MRQARVITLLTDFGTADIYAGVLKGVILREAPMAVPVDLTHDVPPQAVRVAALFLGDALPFFPPGTIHLVVVDPGVGTRRRGLAVRTPVALGVGPDNGVLTPLLRQAIQVVELKKGRYSREPASATFHGRDVFAPAAAALARGRSLEELGPAVEDPIEIDLPEPRREGENEMVGEVLHVDRFGNLITNIRERDVAGWPSVVMEIGGMRITGLAPNYLEGAGELKALVGSSGRVEIALREGSAAGRLAVGTGARIVARPGSATP